MLWAPLILKDPDAAHTPWRAAERTTAVIECRTLLSNTAPPQPVSGFARLAIDGRFGELSIGDVIEITGELVRPATPANPGSPSDPSDSADAAADAAIPAVAPPAPPVTPEPEEKKPADDNTDE